jgi:hypothetical protein
MDAEQRLALALSHAARADVQEQVQEQVQDQVQDQVQEQVQPQAHERVQDQDQVQEKVQQQVQDAASGDVVRVDGVYYFACPHCGATIAVVDIACGIFRCGLLKEGKGETPVPPHADKATCDRLVQQNKVWGCARPFKFDGHRATACGYV